MSKSKFTPRAFEKAQAIIAMYSQRFKQDRSLYLKNEHISEVILGLGNSPDEDWSKDELDFIRELLEKESKRQEEVLEKEKREAELKEELKAYRKEHSGKEIADQHYYDAATGNFPTPVPTGFKKLDEELNGGLYAGKLYLLGAMTSAGKTAFSLQVADNIAKAGRDVLLFELEMAKSDVISRSASREAALNVINNTESGRKDRVKHDHFVSAGAISSGKAFAEESSVDDKANALYGINAYQQYADHIFIFEGNADFGVQKIRETVEKHRSLAELDNNPVVIVDYFQLLPPIKENVISDKTNADDNVKALRFLARDLEISVITISSVKREKYNSPLDLSAFKESGLLEYEADTALALSFAGIELEDGKTFDLEAEKRKNPREMVIKILKNRGFRTGGMIRYRYAPDIDLYAEEGSELYRRLPQR